jgi:glutamyl-tRNA synthetase
MHIGNLFAYLLAWLSAKRRGGRIVLRVEDLDTRRCTDEYARQLQDDLLWLGLAWDEGPLVGGDNAPYEQSKRTALYDAALERLRGLGLVYPCFCTRAELRAASAPHRSDGQGAYPGTCRDLTAAQIAERARTRPPAYRLRVPDEEITVYDGHMGLYRENLARDCGDFLLRRSDGLYAYQLAVVVDDAAMGVTEVVRGSDLLSSAPRQLFLYRLLGLPPPAFYHVPLLLSPDGRRLSKRDHDLSLAALRGRYAPEEVIGKLAYLAGLNPSAAPVGAAGLLPAFDWGAVPVRDIIAPENLFS